MYKVEISPTASRIFENYANRCNNDYGFQSATELLDSYDEKISFLEQHPLIGYARLKNIPLRYRVFNLWPHLWFVFQIKEAERCVKIDYIIDDRQNYGVFLY